MIKHLSHSALQLYRQDKRAFYIRYCAGAKRDYDQTRPAVAGLAFDVLVKSDLTGAPADLSQIQPEHMEWGKTAGAHLLEVYKSSGAYDDLAELVNRADEVLAEDKVYGTVAGVPFTGVVDLAARVDGVWFVIDFKVRGYCGRHNTSPTPGYLRMRNGETLDKQHARAVPGELRGYRISHAPIETFSSKWADQLFIYGELLKVTTPTIYGIDELVGNGSGGGVPRVRVAQHRGQISDQHRRNLWREIQSAWVDVHRGLGFTDAERDHFDRVAKFDENDPAFSNLSSMPFWG